MGGVSQEISKETPHEPAPDLPDRRGRSPGSLRVLAEIRARRVQQGRWLRDALRILMTADEARGHRSRAKELQWRLQEAGAPGIAYLKAVKYPTLRTVQFHLCAIRREHSQHCASSVSALRQKGPIVPPWR